MIPRHRTSLVLATLVVATAFLALASPLAAGARPAVDDAGRVSKSGDELAKAGGARFRGTTSSAGGGKGGTVTFDGSIDFTSRAAEYSVERGGHRAAGNRQGAHARGRRRPVPEPRCGGRHRSVVEPRASRARSG